jgi:hypothetical protein
MNNQEKLVEHINEWFYYFDDYTSPALTICDIASLFEKRIKNFNFILSLPFKDFRERLCEATCTMYKAHIENKIIKCAYKPIFPPKNWNEEMESIWEDYVSMFCLHDDFWNDFWHHIDAGLWESQFPNFRIFIQNILPNYIQRDFNRLEENDLIKQNNEGEYIDINDDDECDDDYGYETS